MKVAPIHIKFALAFLIEPDPIAALGEQHFDSPVGQEAFRWLVENDLVDRSDHLTRGNEKLSAWIGHLCRQPLPEQSWIVPPTDDEDTGRIHAIARAIS